MKDSRLLVCLLICTITSLACICLKPPARSGLPTDPEPPAGDSGTSRVLTGHSSDVTSLDFSPDGTLLASGQRPTLRGEHFYQARVWNVANGRELATVHEGGLRVVTFSPDGTLLAVENDYVKNSGDAVRSIEFVLWNMASQQVQHRLFSQCNDSCRTETASFSPDGATFVGVADHRKYLIARLWDTASGEERFSFSTAGGNAPKLQDMTFSPDGSQVVLVTVPPTIVWHWNTASGDVISKTFDQETSYWNGAVLSPDGTMLAHVEMKDDESDGKRTKTERVYLLDTQSGERLRVLQGPAQVLSLLFSPDGSILASVGDDDAIRLWDTATGEELAVLLGHTYGLLEWAFSDDGTLLGSAGAGVFSEDLTVRIWDVAHGKELAVFRGHAKSIGCIAFSPDGTLLATGAEDRTVRLWQVPAIASE